MSHYARLGAAVILLGLVGAVPATAAPLPMLGIAAKSGQFQPYGPNTDAVTYDQTMVPSGAKVFTLNLQDTHRTVTVLGVRGLTPSRNEIWLDFTADAQGNGFAVATVDWQFPDPRRLRSVVIHEHHTHTDGTAGARLACITVAF
jgi:superoxide dismutase, Cu-Zn family